MFRNRGVAFSVGLLLAAGAGALYAPFFVEAFCWKNPPGVPDSRTFEMLLWTVPLAILAGAAGGAVGLHTAADGKPYPAWRAFWRAAGLGVAVGLMFSVTVPFAFLCFPLWIGAAGLSGLATAFIRKKGNHGPA